MIKLVAKKNDISLGGRRVRRVLSERTKEPARPNGLDRSVCLVIDVRASRSESHAVATLSDSDESRHVQLRSSWSLLTDRSGPSRERAAALLAGTPVEELAQQISVTIVSRVLLNHVVQNPPE